MSSKGCAVLLDWLEDLVVPVADVVHRGVPALITVALVAELPVQRAARAFLAVVEGEGLGTEETNKRIKLADTAEKVYRLRSEHFRLRKHKRTKAYRF